MFFSNICRRRSRPLLAVAVATSYSIAVGVGAQTLSAEPLRQPSNEISLKTAVSRTLAEHPSLMHFAMQQEGLKSSLQTAHLSPITRLGLEVENVAGSGEFDGTSAAETTLALSSVFELGGKRAARSSVVDARSAKSYAEKRIKVLDLTAAVTERFITVAVFQERLDVAEQALRLTRTAVTLVDKRVRAGATPAVELRRARGALAESEISLNRVRKALEGARWALALSWGAEALDFNQVAADIFALEPAPNLSDLLAKVDGNPMIESYASLERLRDAQLRLAKAGSRGDLGWTLGVRHIGESEDVAIVGGVSFDLFSQSRNRGRVGQAGALLKQTRYERSAALRQMKVQLALFQHQQSAAATAAHVLKNKVIPELNIVVEETREAYESGLYSYVEWVSARRELIAAQQSAIDAAELAHRTGLELERLTGASLKTITAHEKFEVSQ